MKFALYLPTVGEFADPGLIGELALEAEERGWDGCFIWDVLDPSTPPWAGPAVDAWVTLAVIADRTSRIQLGPMVTPLSRRRPGKVARETTSIDRLSGGRLVLGVGLGDPSDLSGEIVDVAQRGARVDESLMVLKELWSGEPVDHKGQHFQITTAGYQPRPIRESGIPVWLGGISPNPKPFRRALRWNGFFPFRMDRMMEPDDYRSIRDEVAQVRGTADEFDLVFSSSMDGEKPPMSSWTSYADAGVTWWLQAANTLTKARSILASGAPPR
jgi:alkanesulfonate monooxygenase SsuD/methylene tetrahydromethanopterin reductase-like flavin-dependent oxidoreductase (luciferase family)